MLGWKQGEIMSRCLFTVEIKLMNWLAELRDFSDGTEKNMPIFCITGLAVLNRFFSMVYTPLVLTNTL